jgi:hypothetical protein
MPLSRTHIGLAALVVVSLAGDAVCRRLARGGDQERLLAIAVDAVGRLPEQFGPWHAVDSEPLDESVVRMLECRAHLNRNYRNEDTGETASLILLAGPPGPLLAHTPEVCYSSSSFDVVEPARPESFRTAGEHTDELHHALFRSLGVSGELQVVYYGWRPPAGHWQAPKDPRLSLGGGPMLYKLQVATDIPADDVKSSADSKAPDAGRRLLIDLLPVLDSLLDAR